MSSFGHRLRMERQRLGISQEQVAEATGMKRTSQWSYESDRSMPSVEFLAGVARLGMNVSFLLAGIGINEPESVVEERPSTWASRLRDQRESLGFTQEIFGELAGVTRKSIMRWESGATAPDLISLAFLAGIGVDVHYVITGERAAAPQPPVADPELEAMVKTLVREQLDFVEKLNQLIGESK